MYNKYEIIYNEEGNITVIDQFSGNMGLTVDQALELCKVDMDKFANDQGWDGWDWNNLDIRIVE